MARANQRTIVTLIGNQEMTLPIDTQQSKTDTMNTEHSRYFVLTILNRNKFSMPALVTDEVGYTINAISVKAATEAWLHLAIGAMSA
jgi:hypothetical protein